MFPRIRQAHVNGLAFGWLSMAMVAGWYYVVPRLTKTEIHSETLGIFVAWAWNIALAVGVVGLTLGWTQAREYAELAWPVDIAIMGVLLLTAYNLFRTIMARKEPELYVTLWYIMGTLLWFPIVYAIGNVIWAPPTGSLIGLNDAIWNWFYGHNVLGLWFTTGTAGLIYYIVPTRDEAPDLRLRARAHRLLGHRVLLHRGRHAPHPRRTRSRVAQDHLGHLLDRVADSGQRVRREHVHDDAGIVAGRVHVDSAALRPHRRRRLPAHQHPGLVPGAARLQPVHPLHELARRPRAPRPARLRRLLDVGHGVLHDAENPRRAAALRAARVDALVADGRGLRRLLHRADRGGPRAGRRVRGGIPIIKILPEIQSLWIGRAASGTVIIVGQYIFAYNIWRTALDARKAPAEKPATADAAPAAAGA